MDDERSYEDILSEIDETDTLTLSPIVEMNESNIIDSSLLDEQDITYQHVQGEKTHQEEALLSSSDKSNEDILRCSSLTPRETPPEVLRGRVNALKTQYEYLMREHEDLQEFTKLEKQVHHQHCFSEDEVNLLKSELDSVSQKMLLLIQENLNFRNELEKKETEVQDFKKLYLTSENTPKMIKKHVSEIAQRLKENLQKDTEKVIKECPSLKTVLLNNNDNEEIELLNPDSRKIVNTLEEIKKMIDFVMKDNIQLKNELNKACLDNSNLELNSKQLLQEYEQTKNSLSISREKLNLAFIKEQEINDLAKLSEAKLKENEKLLSLALLDNKNLQSKLKNIKSVDSIQEEFSFILNQLKLLFDSPDLCEFRKISFSLKRNKKLVSCVNDILNSQNQSILFEMLHAIDERLKIYDDKYEGLELLVKDLSFNVDQFAVQIEEMGMDLHVLQSIKTDICNKTSLEKALTTTRDENVCLKENVVSLEEENKNLKIELKIIQSKFSNLLELQNMTQQKNMSLESETNRFKTDFQNVCILIREIGNLIDSWDIKMGLKNVIDILDLKQTVFKSIDLFLNLNTQTVLHEVLNKLKVKLLCYDSYISSRMRKEIASNKYIIQESNKLKSDIELLQKTVKEELTNRVVKLEASFVCCKETVEFQCKTCITNVKDSDTKQEYKGRSNVLKVDNILKELKCIANIFEKYPYPENNSSQFKQIFDSFLENKQDFPNLNLIVDKDIADSLFNCFDQIYQKLCLSEEERSTLLRKVEELSFNIKVLENENLNLKKTYVDSKDECNKSKRKMLMQAHKSNSESDNDPVKELAILKDLLVIEILNLDGDENKNDLLNCSPKEIMDKFMQCIMKVEKQVQEQYEKHLQEKENSLDSVNKKIKNQESWICELETENNKLENKIITLSDNLKNTLNDVANLKTEISKVTKENITLKDKLKEANKLITAEKDSVNNLKNNLKSLKEDIVKKKEEIVNLSARLADMVCKQNKCCIYMQSKLNSESQVICENENIKQPECFQDRATTMEDILKTSNRDTNSCKTISEMEWSVENFNKEKVLLQELLTNDDSKYSDNISDKFYFLKDVVQIVLNKLLELENVHANIQSKFQNTVDSVFTDLTDLKLSLFQLYKEFVPDEKANSAFIDVLSLKKELEYVEIECLQITKMTDKFKNDIESGQSFINGLKEQFIVVKNEISRKDALIDNLSKTISDEQNKKAESKSELEAITNQLNYFALENKQLKDEIQNLNLQLSDSNKIFSSKIFNTSVEMKNVNEKINYLNEMLKESICNKSYIIASDQSISFFSNQCYLMRLFIERLEKKESLFLMKIKQTEDQMKHINLMLSSVLSGTHAEKKDLKEKINHLHYICRENVGLKCSVAEANEDIIFFSYHCNLMTSYINEIELMFNELQVEKDQLFNDCNLMKNQLNNTNYRFEQSNMAISNLVSLLPNKPSTSSKALKLVQQIINEHTSLKEAEVNFIKKHKTINDTVCKQTEEIKCLKKLNENLKIDLGNCEDHIRNLRSELRTLRFQYQKKMAEDKTEPAQSLKKCASAESGIQTDILCCTQLEDDISILKKTLNERNIEITSLKGRIQAKSSPYKRRCDLELALIQAKERIKELKLELIQQQNYNKDLKELCTNHKN